jgi:hypothetical protein
LKRESPGEGKRKNPKMETKTEEEKEITEWEMEEGKN